MVKPCVNFRNSLFVWVYLKGVFFWRGDCFYFVFVLINFGSLAPLIFLKKLFFINIYFLSYETLHIFCLYKTCIFYQNIKLSFIKANIVNIKQFNISNGNNWNFLSDNFNGLNSIKKQGKMYLNELI